MPLLASGKERAPAAPKHVQSIQNRGLGGTPILFTIRAARSADIPGITAIYNEAIRNTTATFDTEEKNLADRTEWLASHDNHHPITVAVDNETVLGWASLTRWSDRCAYSGTAEISVYVHENYRGQGIGKALMHDIVQRGRLCGLHTLVSRIVAGNDVSIHLHEDVGFFHIGVMREVGSKFGSLLDVVMMQLIYSNCNSGCDAATKP